MALSLGKKKASGSVGLDIDGSFLAAVQTSGGGVSRAVSTELAPGLINDGEVADVAGLAEAIALFFKRNDLPRSVNLGVANQQIAVRHLELPVIEDDREREAAVRFQAAEAIAMPLEEVVLDYQPTGEGVSADGVARMHVVVVAARDSMIERFVDAVRIAGLKTDGIDLNAFALVRTLATSASGDQEPTTRVYCHLAGVTNLAVAHGSTCLFTRALSTVWDDDAENTAAALAEEIRLSIEFYMAQPDARPVTDVVLSGPGSTQPGLADELGELIDLPVSGADPLGTLIAAIPPEEDPYRHTVAAGLALGGSA
jgi:type IV pilus assembly protein PilM